MSKRSKSRNALIALAEQLKGDLTELIKTAEASPPSTRMRKRLDMELRALVSDVDTLLRTLDPVRQPHSMLDPGDPAVVGRFIALAMISQPRSALATAEPFYGSGVYALYYKGDFELYAPLKNNETPIYVGKADPQSDTAKTPIEQGDKLYGRLKDHRRSIQKTSDTLSVNDFEYRSLVVQSGWQGAAEDYLIYLFKPIWNNETGICYGIGKHGDAPTTRANLRSPWDTIHPGRDWAYRDAEMRDARPREQIIMDLKKHFSQVDVYSNLDQVLREFVEELRQI